MKVDPPDPISSEALEILLKNLQEILDGLLTAENMNNRKENLNDSNDKPN